MGALNRCKPWTYIETQRAREMRLSGVPVKMIAAVLGRDEKAVSFKLCKMGVYLRRNPISTSDLDALVKRLHKPGVLDTDMLDEIRRRTGKTCSKSSVNRARRRLGLPGVPRSEVNRQNNYVRWAYHNARKLETSSVDGRELRT